MSRGIEDSGGELHIRMVKSASKALIDRFNTLKVISLEYEGHAGARINVAIDRLDRVPSMESIDFRPDIIVRHTPEIEKGLDNYQIMTMREKQGWSKIEDSQFIIFEIETDPANILKNSLKMAFYGRMKNSDTRWGRAIYAFVLVTLKKYDNLESNTAAYRIFDEIWFLHEDEQGIHKIPFMEPQNGDSWTIGYAPKEVDPNV